MSRAEAEPCSRALAQARVYLGQLRGRGGPAGPEGGGRRDYLVEAARQLRLALERDVSEDYQEAFNHYQNGVDVLLRGVQVDPNKERREAVKRKITQYLRRAEEIFNCHLQRAAGANSSATVRGRSLPGAGCTESKSLPCCTTHLPVPSQSLPKSHVETRERQTIIPHGVPFMVKLLCYYVSEDSIFLHLEHVQGETLWSHLRSKYRVQQDCADSNTIQVLRDHGTEDGVGNSQGGSQVSILPVWTGSGLPGSVNYRVLGNTDASLPQEQPPANLTCGQLSKQPPSGQCRALASHGHNRRVWAVNEEQVQLWAAEILLALEGLHQQGVLCRDLNPRNLLLDTAGHVRLTFFGQWTEVEPHYCSQAREDLYSAPEVGGIMEPTEAADCWSFGSLLYELLAGVPLSQNHPSGIQPHTQLHLPEGLSLAATSLLTELLQYNPKRRLGSGGDGISKLKSHSFFSTVPWNKLVG
ncbi:hypothetical protein HGM15179_000727 [Zosterops borbonicus]|uniref:Protein kinase domain-containing protein n=1 Tax=Zosterops borbonicus TaxID=364589 RepID=A0A8K1LUR8_9PASS|nr:hypothetical protein HGM15179_000727 [Zosterops borbonicus]